MPPGVRSLRAMLHATAVEVLLYLTPLHCHDMLSSLVEAMNAQFSKFMLRHPDFQVSSWGWTPLGQQQYPCACARAMRQPACLDPCMPHSRRSCCAAPA